MFCPNPDCLDFVESGVHGEYVDGISSCPTCGSYLVEKGALESAGLSQIVDHDIDVEMVFVSADTTEITVVRSMIEGAGIPYIMDGLADQEYLGLGQAGIGIGRRGGVGIRVRTEDVEAVRAMLQEYEVTEDGS